MQHCRYANFRMYRLNPGVQVNCTECKSGGAMQSDLALISVLPESWGSSILGWFAALTYSGVQRPQETDSANVAKLVGNFSTKGFFGQKMPICRNQNFLWKDISVDKN